MLRIICKWAFKKREEREQQRIQLEKKLDAIRFLDELKHKSEVGPED